MLLSRYLRQLNTKRDTPAEHGRCNFFGHINIHISIESSCQSLSYYCSITYAVQRVKEIIGEKASMGNGMIKRPPSKSYQEKMHAYLSTCVFPRRKNRRFCMIPLIGPSALSQRRHFGCHILHVVSRTVSTTQHGVHW